MDPNTETSVSQATLPDSGFIQNILTPGSSLHPTVLLILDIAFAALLFVFIILLFLTKGNLHVFALIGIEGCLWASVKWFVSELKKLPPPSEETKKKEE